MRGKRKEKVERPVRERPPYLRSLALVTLLFASLYFLTMLLSVTRVWEETEDRLSLFGYVAFMAILFYIYTSHLGTTFRLQSGSRRAWQHMSRISVAYILLAVISLNDGRDTVWITQSYEINAILAGAAMVVMLLYLNRSRVREYFTPSYADNPPLWQWLLFIVGRDPFKKGNLRLI